MTSLGYWVNLSKYMSSYLFKSLMFFGNILKCSAYSYCTFIPRCFVNKWLNFFTTWILLHLFVAIVNGIFFPLRLLPGWYLHIWKQLMMFINALPYYSIEFFYCLQHFLSWFSWCFQLHTPFLQIMTGLFPLFQIYA